MGGINTDSHFDNDYHLDKKLLVLVRYHFDNDYHLDKKLLVWVVHAKYI